nr:unnamed protein product [Callosobruchus analis]
MFGCDPCNRDSGDGRPETSSNKFSTCTHCDATFKRKSSLDNHLIKQHPNFISSVTNKIHKCTKCSYETTISAVIEKLRENDLATHSNADGNSFICYHCKNSFLSKHLLISHMIVHDNKKIMYSSESTDSRHLLEHSETRSKYKLSTCTHCKLTFKRKHWLDNHVIRKHPNFIDSVTSKVHECTLCGFKTTKKISLDDHIIKYHPNFASSVTSKIHKCTKCNFETTMCTDLKRHSMKHAETPDKHMLSTCRFCQAMFKSKTSVDDHILRKHPTFIASVTSKIHECAKCTFKTVYTNNLKKHLFEQSETRSKYKLSTCTHCNLTFKRKHWLDNHVIRKHPNFIDSVTSKVHECILCGFKTTISAYFKRHMLKHPETSSNYRFSTCTHCDRTFKTKSLLDNHLIKKHPNFVSSVTNKIHKCTMCSYETTISTNLRSHLLIHAKTPAICRPITCPHCKASFNKKISLDDHIIKYHPSFASSVTSKVHKCTKCNFETTMCTDLKRHSMKHAETPDKHMLSTCRFCQATFKSKTSVDDHILRKHPNFIASVTSKIHECAKCTFKTVYGSHLKSHLSRHSETPGNCQKITCPHCKAKFRRRTLLDNHVIKKHPNFVSSVTSKIYKCTKCAFETTINTHLKRHSLKHTETRPNHRPNTCALCHASFKTKRTLDNHTLQKHPKFIDSVTSKIHECTLCTFKTTMNAGFKEHLLKHPETISSYKFSACVQCNTTFKRKIFLDDHIVKKHPDFMESVTSRIHECRKCTFKTAFRNDLNRHSLNHLETAPSL